jgi:3-hydroxyisobutyrate dehydrogenase-like beta-hydroxyacid dehydrogenase
MGGAMAVNLLRSGFDVVGFDLDENRVEDLRAHGGRAAASPAAVAESVDFAITSLPSVDAFESVAYSAGGLGRGARVGLVVIETSTLPIAVKENARDSFARHGVTLLDCPLSGTGDQAITKDVIVLASGEQEAVERSRPVFDGFARAVHYVGEFGTGSKLKFIANHLVAVHNLAAAEAFVLARAAGLDLERFFEVISDGAGTSRMFEVRVPKMIHGDYRGGVRTRVFQKDLALIGEFAAAAECPVPLFALSTQFYAAAAAAGFANQDTASVCEVLAAMMTSRAPAA